jgi:hypothetical protein
MGADTDAVLAELGYDKASIAAIRAAEAMQLVRPIVPLRSRERPTCRC